MDYLPYILLALFLLGLWPQLRVIWAARRQRGRPAPQLDDLLEAEWLRHERLLVYFYSPHCGPCRQLSPRVDELAGRHGNVLKVDVSQRPELAQRFNVRATPTLVLLAGGQVEQVLVGAVSAKRLAGLLAG